MDFEIGLLLSMDKTDDSYDTILVIINCLINMVQYKLMKTIINKAGVAKLIINIVIIHHDIPKLIISNQGLLITLKL